MHEQVLSESDSHDHMLEPHTEKIIHPSLQPDSKVKRNTSAKLNLWVKKKMFSVLSSETCLCSHPKPFQRTGLHAERQANQWRHPPGPRYAKILRGCEPTHSSFSSHPAPDKRHGRARRRESPAPVAAGLAPWMKTATRKSLVNDLIYTAKTRHWRAENRSSTTPHLQKFTENILNGGIRFCPYRTALLICE